MNRNNSSAAGKSTNILIGLLGAGKSMFGVLLAEKLSLAIISIDDYRWDYYRELGYDKLPLNVDEQFAKHPSNHQLAQMIVYTVSKTREEGCAEIMQRLVKSKPEYRDDV